MTNAFIAKNKISILVTALFLIVGIFAYFLWVPLLISQETIMSAYALDLLKSDTLQFKAVYTDTGDLEVFVLAKNNDLAKLKVVEGFAIPESNSIVVGFSEGTIMKEKKRLNATDVELSDLFGKTMVIGGILAQTQTPVDDFHFASNSDFAALTGDTNRIFLRVVDGKATTLFYSLSADEIINQTKLQIPLAQGSLENYKIDTLAGITYYPVIVGSDEAINMRERKLFSTVGDTIRDFFGNNIVIAGVLNKTNTPLDAMYILALSSEQIQ